VWQVPRVNPAFPVSCGLDVALIIDLSGSLAGDLDEVQDASNAMVTALEGTNSRVGVYTFASNAPATAGGNLAITQVATAGGADIVRNHIDGFTTPTGGTNWDRGIGQVLRCRDRHHRRQPDVLRQRRGSGQLYTFP
jgi:hypothetical protein